MTSQSSEDEATVEPEVLPPCTEQRPTNQLQCIQHGDQLIERDCDDGQRPDLGPTPLPWSALRGGLVHDSGSRGRECRLPHRDRWLTRFHPPARDQQRSRAGKAVPVPDACRAASDTGSRVLRHRPQPLPPVGSVEPHPSEPSLGALTISSRSGSSASSTSATRAGVVSSSARVSARWSRNRSKSASDIGR